MHNYLVQGDLLPNGVKKHWNVPSLIATFSIKRNMINVTDPTSTVRPVCGHESTERCVLTPKHVENDQTRTVRPVKVEELDFDFRVPGLSHSVVKEPEHLRVQEHVQRISEFNSMSRRMDSSTTTQVAKIMVQYGGPSRSSWTKSVWSSFGRTVMGKAIWENPIEGRFGECLFVHREKGLFLSVYVDDIKLAGKKQNIDPMWKVLNKEVDLGEPTSFLDHVYLGCTQSQCEISKDIVDNSRTMFESRISAGWTGKLPYSRIFVFLRGPTIWRVMPRNVWNDIVSWQTGRLNNSTKYLLDASMTITSKRKNWNL